MTNKDEGFQADTTKVMLLKHEDEFLNIFGTLHWKLTGNNTAASVPVSQRVEIILLYHWDIDHT